MANLYQGPDANQREKSHLLPSIIKPRTSCAETSVSTHSTVADPYLFNYNIQTILKIYESLYIYVDKPHYSWYQHSCGQHICGHGLFGVTNGHLIFFNSLSDHLWSYTTLWSRATRSLKHEFSCTSLWILNTRKDATHPIFKVFRISDFDKFYIYNLSTYG